MNDGPGEDDDEEEDEPLPVDEFFDLSIYDEKRKEIWDEMCLERMLIDDGT